MLQLIIFIFFPRALIQEEASSSIYETAVFFGRPSWQLYRRHRDYHDQKYI